MMRKPGVLVCLVLPAALALAAAGYFLFAANRGPVVLVLTHSIRSEAVIAAIREEVSVFEDANPGINVEIEDVSERDGHGDIAVLAEYPRDISEWENRPAAWGGSLWVLAGRSDVLDSLSGDAPELVSALESGRLEPSGWENLLAAASAADFVPISLGNSHRWPYMHWFQFWIAATAGPEHAGTLPDAAEIDEPPFARAAADLARWREAGWFHPDAWPLGWAQGLVPLDSGEAVFSILSETQLAALSADARNALSFYAFPRREGSQEWTVGNADYLAVSSRSRHPGEAELLFAHLTDPYVTARLSRATRRPFFSWENRTENPPLVLDSWSTLVNTNEFRAVSDALLAALPD